ncbi:hypothetical protein [Chamaesiphon sp.]|uniref:hypothetical protein n=1 Tax=Chamaesiphon sp. TaxID=2814140 RepID=UPI003593D565
MITRFKSKETESIFRGRVFLKYPRSIQVDALSIAENYRCGNLDGRSTNPDCLTQMPQKQTESKKE